MELSKIIKELEEDVARTQEAIAALQKLASLRGQKRRGRPPGWMKAAKEAGQESKRIN